MTTPASARARSWNASLAACPGDLDLAVPAAQVEGRIPDALRGGRVLSNGPGWTRIGGHTAHPFDGHGYLRSLSLTEEGGCELRARFVRTASYLAEAEAGHLVHRGFATNLPGGFWKNLGFGPRRNVANTTVTRWGGRLLAGWEAGAPHALDPESLETRGEHDFGGVIAEQATLAHMRKDHARGRLVLCSLEQSRHATFTFREVDEQDQVRSTREATLEGMVFAHDYALTPSWYLLAGNPLQLKAWEMAKTLAGMGTLLRAVAPDGRQPGVLHLVSRDPDGPLRRVTLPGPLFVVHFGNAFEEEDGTVVVDACGFERFEFGEEFGYSGPHGDFDPGLPEARGPQRLLRITIPPGSDEASWEPLTAHGVDFPRFHPEHEGRVTPWLFGATREDLRYSDPFDSLIGLDLEDPERPEQLWTTSANTFVGEPLFAPDPVHPERGHVLALLSDGIAERTTLAIFDARALAQGPVATVPLPLLPVAFHGDWEAPGSVHV